MQSHVLSFSHGVSGESRLCSVLGAVSLCCASRVHLRDSKVTHGTVLFHTQTLFSSVCVVRFSLLRLSKL